MYSVYFTDLSKGWAVGAGILRTTDGGASWIAQPSVAGNWLYSVYFTDMNRGWSVGASGTILRTSTSLVSVDDENPSQQMPKRLVLAQGYPNPFNPSTTIRFILPKTSYVTLKIYNLCGEEIETLVRGEHTAGEYEVKWNAENLTSGIYFYRLQAGDDVETKRLVFCEIRFVLASRSKCSL